MQHFATPQQRESFRHFVSTLDPSAFGPTDSANIWLDLVQGRSSIADAFTTAHHCYLAVAVGAAHVPLSQRGRRALELALTGKSHKVLAIELHLSQSTITAVLKGALASLGVGGLPSKVPLSLATLVHTTLLPDQAAQLLGASLVLDGHKYDILRAQMPSLTHVLSPAVGAVVDLHAAGKTYAEIAAGRSTSTRTVANQLAAAFQRLGISGRASLLAYFAKRPPASLGAEAAGVALCVDRHSAA
jgi:DNA-binding CsgD family transcriptional regulator